MHTLTSASVRFRNQYLLLAVLLTLTACNKNDEVLQVSELPASNLTNQPTLAEAQPGTFALRARIRYADIEALAASQLPERYPVEGTKRVCKRIIGIKACGTTQWQLNVSRPGNLSVRGHEGIVYLRTPISFNGKVGVEGGMAKALGLSALDVSGRADASIALSVHMAENWCPSIRADVSYQWREKPTLVYQNALDFSLESVVNDALDKQLATVETRLNKAIDCHAFKQQLDAAWRSYSFALELPAVKGGESVRSESMLDASTQGESTQNVYLNIVPTEFAFSGLRTEEEKLGVSFALGATTVVESQAQADQKLSLPPLKQVSFAESRTDFELVLRADYTQLEQLIRPQLIGKTYTSDSAAGDVSVTINAFDLSGNAQDVTVELGFTAKVPGQRKPVTGLVYLLATPVMNANTDELVLDNIRMSRVLDSTLWNLLSRIFEGQIIAALERNATLDLAPRLRNLETRLTQQLQDPSRTAGLNVIATNLSIKVMELVAEPQTLAARARVSSEFDIDIPLTVLQAPLD